MFGETMDSMFDIFPIEFIVECITFLLEFFCLFKYPAVRNS